MSTRSAHDTAALGAVIGSLEDAVMAESDEGFITVANAAFCRMCGLPEDPAALIGRSAADLRESLWKEFVADVPAVRRSTADLRRERRPQIGHEIQLTDGRILDCDYIPVALPGGSVVHVWHYRDVTVRRQLEARLRESTRRLRRLSDHAERVRERERRQLARTLHDELGQLLSSIRLELVAAIGKFRERSDESMRPIVDRLQAAAGLTDIGLSALRSLATSLRPPLLDHLGLVEAIRWEASLFSKRTGIRCHVRARPADLTIDEAQVTAFYRIALEALENVYRHAHAGTAWIYLTRRRGMTLMEVRDNGRGISDEQINNPRTMGLLGMRERALALGGEVRVTRARRHGTRVLIILPDAESA